MHAARAMKGLLAALLAGALHSPAHAQALPGADTLSPKGVTETLEALNRAKTRVRGYPNDAAGWYRLGMAAWTLGVRARASDPPKDIDAIKMMRLADSALALAAAILPDSVHYRVALGRLLLSQPASTAHSAARVNLDRAVKAAKKLGSTHAIADASLWLGRAYWGEYDAFANRAQYTGAGGKQPISLTAAMSTMSAESAEQLEQLLALNSLVGQVDPETNKRIENAAELTPSKIMLLTPGIGQIVLPMSGMASFKDAKLLLQTGSLAIGAGVDAAGSADFERAFDAFHDAYASDPAHPGVFRGMAMIYAEKSRWPELEALAMSHVARFPNDSLAWMTLGLARHRMQKDAGARAAFDTAMRMVSATERRRLDRIERVLRPGSRIAPTTAPERLTAMEQLYWALSNPLWMDGQRTKVEFLARVTFAELRWTVEELSLNGADTDRGDIHIRYGPPDQIIAFGPGQDIAEITTFWLYNSGLVFAFRGMPGFKTSHFVADDLAMVEGVESAVPVHWGNMPTPKIDTLSSRFARFRNQPGTVDLVLSAELAKPDSIAKTMSIVASVRRQFTLFDPAQFKAYRDEGVVKDAGIATWRQSVPASTYVYRAEEFGETASRGNRATTAIDASALGFAPLGFGISDLLTLGAPVTTSGQPVRVRDLPIEPAMTVQQGASVTVLWENYELTPKDGQAQYAVKLTLARIQSAAGRIAASVLGTLGQLASVARENDRISISFDRARASSPAFADDITLALGETPAGRYLVTLEVTDRVSGKAVTRSTEVVVR